MEKHSISKLLGAPPGYIGFEQPGALTEEVRRQPYSVLLFDEIEKAHPDILNLLLQILDDGHLRDSRGRLINFKNTLIIMTSNIGSQNILENRNDDALKEIKQYLKPELFNRIDEIIIFNPINNIVIKEIIRKQLDELIERLKIQDYEISYSELIINKIRNEGFDQTYGARPLKRYIQKNIENILANEILANKIKKNKEYIITVDKTKKIVIAEKKKN
jgi:ATP-dependent Clp protease ATP-binding subunit ClpB